MTRRRTLAVAALIAGLLTAPLVRRDLHGLALVVRAANLQGIGRQLANIDTVPIEERLVGVPASTGAMRARVFAPRGRARQTVLLVSGLHPAGIDEPRLMALARQLAEADVTVVTPDIPELSRFEIVPVVTDRIEEAARWVATNPDLAPSGRIGLMGISFSGGLALVAAGRPALQSRLLYVFSFGGHDDLRRVIEYFCTGCERGAIAAPPPPPHDYGVAVVLLNVAGHLVPPSQLEPLRAAVRRFLWASYLDGIDRPAAQREFAALRETAGAMPEPSATLLRYVNERDVAHLGPMLEPYIASYVDQPALSPALSPAPSAPIYLLHGRSDNVIPAAESCYLAERLHGRATVRLLVTDLISHVDTDQPAHVIDVVKLADFWGDLLAR